MLIMGLYIYIYISPTMGLMTITIYTNNKSEFRHTNIMETIVAHINQKSLSSKPKTSICFIFFWENSLTKLPIICLVIDVQGTFRFKYQATLIWKCKCDACNMQDSFWTGHSCGLFGVSFQQMQAKKRLETTHFLPNNSEPQPQTASFLDRIGQL